MIPTVLGTKTSDTDYTYTALPHSASAHLKSYVDGYSSSPDTHFYRVYHKIEAWAASTPLCTVWVTSLTINCYHCEVKFYTSMTDNIWSAYYSKDRDDDDLNLRCWVGTDGYGSYHYVVWPFYHYDVDLEVQYSDCKVYPPG